MRTIRGCGYETYERGNDPSFRLGAGYSPEVEDIVLKATDKYQTNRYKSADEMVVP